MLARITFILAFCILCISTAFSQSASSRDSIDMVNGNGFTGPRFYKGNTRITMSQVNQLIGQNPQALPYLTKSKTNNIVAIGLGLVGGFFVGYQLGSLLAGKKINGALMGTGIGLIGISIPFGISGSRNLKKALSVYNAAYR